MNSLCQFRASLLGIDAADSGAKCSALSDDQDLFLGTGNGGIDQRPHKHNGVGTLKIDNDAFVFRTLGFVDCTGVTEIQHIKIPVFIVDDTAISKVDPHHRIGLGASNTLDIAYITVIDVLAVLDLHDFITGSEPSLAMYSVGFSIHRRIDLPLEPLIQCVSARFRLLTVRGQQHHIVDSVLGSFLQVQRLNDLSRYG